MNDAAANVVSARHGEAGRRRIRDRGAGLHAEPDPRRCPLRRLPRARSPACPDIDALYIKDPGGLLIAEACAHADSGDQGRRSATSRWSCIPTAPSGSRSWPTSTRPISASAPCSAPRGAAADGISNPPIERIVANLRTLGHRVDVDDEALAAVSDYFTRLAEAEGLPAGRPQAFRRRLSAPPAPRRHGRHDAPASRREPPVAPRRRGDRGAGPGSPGTGLADRHDAVRADGAHAGGHERDRGTGAIHSHSR